MPRLKEETCRPGAKLRNMFSAWEARLVKHFINSFRVVTWNGREPYIDRSDPFGEYTIYIPRSSGGATFPWSKLAFGYALTGTICTIYAGTVRIHGIGKITVSQTDVALTGNPAFVTLEFARPNGAASLVCYNSDPTSTATTIRIPLYQFDITGSGYTLAKIHNMGDINFDTPLA